MKKHFLILTTTVLCLGLAPAFAQFGKGPGGPKFDGAMAKLFGDNSAFSAAVETQLQPESGDTITMPGKMAFDAGKVRFEMNMGDAKGLKMPPGAAEQMKAMGFDQMITLSLPEKKQVYLIYPGLESYVATSSAAKDGTNDTFKLEVKEVGKETVGGHPCVQNDVIVTDGKGATNEFTVWNATDLKKFPVKISHMCDGPSKRGHAQPQESHADFCRDGPVHRRSDICDWADVTDPECRADARTDGSWAEYARSRKIRTPAPARSDR